MIPVHHNTLPGLIEHLNVLYICTSGFVGDVIFAHNGQEEATAIWCTVKMTRQEAAPRAKCDVFDCSVLLCKLHANRTQG